MAGSQWGTVSLSPAPNGGKYEAGTIVNMTAVNDSVSTFLNWEDATTGKTRSITVDGDKTFTATFSEKAFIVGWDLVTAEPKSTRPGDYYSKAANKGVFSAYEPAGTAVNWLTYTGGGIPCGLLWTSNLSTRRYFKASFSTTGYKNIKVHSNMYAYNQAYYTGQKMQYSTDGTNFTDLASCTLLSSNWVHFPATLPPALEDQTIVYLRWIADETSTAVGSGNDGTGISNIYVFAEEIATFDPVKPTLISTVPVNGSTGASANGSITLTFDKNVKAGTGDCILDAKVLTPVFGSKTATFNYTKLAYNTAYTFTVPAGALTNVDGIAYEGITVNFTTMNRPTPTAKLFDAVVAKDGTGDYTSVIAAVNAAPTGRTQPWLIFVKNGTYSGHVEIPANKPYINLIGQSRENVIISDARICGSSTVYPDSAVYSVDPGASVVVKSANCYFENICFENKFGYDNLTGPQALALYTQNDRTILNNCWLRSYQDTYLTTYGNVAYRHYIKNCRIEGAVDFIYGGGDVFFDKCTLYLNRSAGGYIVAPSHQTGTQWGYVFSNCTIDGASPSYTTYLGRPWANSPKTSFLNTTAKINIYPEGWLEHMGAIPAIFADYNTVDGNGDLTDMSARIDQYWIGDVSAKVWGTAKKSFTNEEAATYTMNNVLTGSDAWDPAAIVETTEIPANVINTSGTLTWNATSYAICYVILRDNVVIGFTTSNTFTDNTYSGVRQQNVPGLVKTGGASEYKVIAVAESGALSSPAIASNSGVPTGLDNQTTKIFAFIKDNKMIINNLEPGSLVSVYSFNGMLMNEQKAKSNSISMPFSSSCIVKITSEKETLSLKLVK
jgi:pectin methylesterase-like acyl-CoA thioesterase